MNKKLVDSIVIMEDKYKYKYKNLSGGFCLVYTYYDEVLVTRHRVRGTFYKGRDILDFLNEKVLSGNACYCYHYLENIDKYRREQELKGGINNEM